MATVGKGSCQESVPQRFLQRSQPVLDQGHEGVLVVSQIMATQEQFKSVTNGVGGEKVYHFPPNFFYLSKTTACWRHRWLAGWLVICTTPVST